MSNGLRQRGPCGPEAEPRPAENPTMSTEVSYDVTVDRVDVLVARVITGTPTAASYSIRWTSTPVRDIAVTVVTRVAASLDEVMSGNRTQTVGNSANNASAAPPVVHGSLSATLTEPSTSIASTCGGPTIPATRRSS